MKTWTALTLALPPAFEDDILLALDEARTIGVEVLEPAPVGEGGEGPARNGAGVRRAVAYFDPGADLRSLLTTLGKLGGSLVLETRDLIEEAWVEMQQASRRPLAVGERFLIVPEDYWAGCLPQDETFAGSPSPVARSEHEYSTSERIEPGERHRHAPRSDSFGECMAETRAVAAGRIVLVVPVGRAFGTGEHETTRLCLEQIERIPLAGLSVLDLGTGSGILAMAAARLGAARVVALDVDEEAAAIAAENLRLNDLPDATRSPAALAGTLDALTMRFDVILANLYPLALEEARSELSAHQPPAGTLVLSGFSREETETLSALYASVGYSEASRSALGEWGALVMRKTRP